MSIVEDNNSKLTHPHQSQPFCAALLTKTNRARPYLTRITRAPHFTPQHWLLCHIGIVLARDRVPLSSLTTRAYHTHTHAHHDQETTEPRLAAALGPFPLLLPPLSSAAPAAAQSTVLGGRIPAAAAVSEDPAASSHSSPYSAPSRSASAAGPCIAIAYAAATTSSQSCLLR